ncbi:MAG: molybdopterin-synthase adenylyltransferase MoeB [Candidatus Hydrogenedentota bacterium]|nr:MAG: molybdopterin-synthase adenylyltransferase MoeB [Candidatus Hydrogenedentota bacterium]
MELTHEEIRRYSRHLIMPEFGMAAQKKLKAASVLIIGAGGLGCPLAQYLAAAGVGKLGIVDFDVVDFSNLQRQVLYTTADVGKPKAEVAKARIEAMNPNVKVQTYTVPFKSDNAMEIAEGYDVIIDGTDNFPTRYLVNDLCVLTGRTNVFGSIFRFDGQVTVFNAKEGPCYRCLYPDPPPPGMVPSCAEGGVLGILPGVVGVMQATEAIKVITGIGEPLIGRLVIFDALKMKFRELKIRKNPDCPVCGEHPTVKELIDYEQFCGVNVEGEDLSLMDEDVQMTVFDLQDKLEDGEKPYLLDVRTPQEYEICHFEDSKLIPLDELPNRINEVPLDEEVVVLCHHGNRSMRAIEFMKQAGYKKLKNLAGGIDAWAMHIDKDMPRY